MLEFEHVLACRRNISITRVYDEREKIVKSVRGQLASWTVSVDVGVGLSLPILACLVLLLFSLTGACPLL